MVDLGGQYQKIKSEVNDSITEILESSAFINGPAVKEFQINLEKYLGVKHVIPCANGTDALQIAMMGLGLKPGDEVITAAEVVAAAWTRLERRRSSGSSSALAVAWAAWAAWAVWAAAAPPPVAAAACPWLTRWAEWEVREAADAQTQSNPIDSNRSPS